MNNVGISYLLWCGCFFGLAGLHRLYNGKIFSGLLWLFTWGFFGIGQFIDLFFIPSMVVDENNLRMRPKLDPPQLSNFPGLYVSPPTTASKPVSPAQLMILLTKAAQKRGGKISLTQAVLDTEIPYEDVQDTLNQMMKKGYIVPGNDPDKGFVVYDFLEL